MIAKILCLNVGSSSLKFSVYDADENLACLLSGGIERIGKPDTTLKVTNAEGATQEKVVHTSHLAKALPVIASVLTDANLHDLSGVAHRIVHGGPEYTDHQRITPELLEGLRKIAALAPNHLPPEIDFIEAALRQFADTPQFACFDTVFHRDLPDVARRLPLPRRLYDQGIRRYGFHGLSYSYIMQKLPELIGDTASGRVILAHLGSGASMTAVKKGKSVDTTMGVTPLGGLVMATRSGDLDPGIAGYLAKTENLSGDAYEHMVYAESGLLGLSETSGDIRDLLAREGDDPRAAQAIEAFCYSVRKWTGALAAALEGVDVLVFTGGIGANSHVIRQRICDQLDWLGILLDMGANVHGEPCISAPQAKIMVFALPTDEERFMAETVLTLLPTLSSRA